MREQADTLVGVGGGLEGLSEKENKEKTLMDTDSNVVFAGGGSVRGWRSV